MHLRRFRFFVCVFACLLGPLASGGTSREAMPSGVPTEAIWQIQHFDLYFRATRGRFHSCSSLHEKITGIMEAIGAGVVVVDISCGAGSLVGDTFARIATALPVAATSDNIRNATTFQTEDQLIARLRQTELPTAETIERFPAEWETVSLMSVRGLRLGPEDCELLQDMQQQVFPHVSSVRVVRKRLFCGSTMQMHPPRPVLVVEALRRRDA